MAGPFRPCRDHRAADEETTAAPTTRGKTTGPDGAFRGGRELLGERPQPLTQQNHGHVECLTPKQMQPLLNEVAVAVPAVRASWIYRGRGRGSMEGPPQAAFRC